MPGEATVRIESTSIVQKKIDEQKLGDEKLPLIPSSSFWKPVNVSLTEFHPFERVVRLRTFADGRSKAESIDVERLPDGAYTHRNELLKEGTEEECIEVLTQKGFEKWVQFSQESTKCDLPNGLVVLVESFGDISSTLKFEAPQEDIIWAFLEDTDVTKDNITNLNTAELLAKNLGLI